MRRPRRRRASARSCCASPCARTPKGSASSRSISRRCWRAPRRAAGARLALAAAGAARARHRAGVPVRAAARERAPHGLPQPPAQRSGRLGLRRPADPAAGVLPRASISPIIATPRTRCAIRSSRSRSPPRSAATSGRSSGPAVLARAHRRRRSAMPAAGSPSPSSRRIRGRASSARRACCSASTRCWRSPRCSRGSDLLVALWLAPALLGQPFLRMVLLAEHTGCPLVPEMLRNARTTRTIRRCCDGSPGTCPITPSTTPTRPCRSTPCPAAHALLEGKIAVQADGYVAVQREIIGRLPGRAGGAPDMQALAARARSGCRAAWSGRSPGA